MYKYLAAAAVVFATPVLAQSVPEKSGVNSTLGISPSTQDFVTEAANSDMLEIESSKLVAAKGDAKNQAFADQMIKDHTATSDELKGLVSRGKVQRTRMRSHCSNAMQKAETMPISRRSPPRRCPICRSI